MCVAVAPGAPVSHSTSLGLGCAAHFRCSYELEELLHLMVMRGSNYGLLVMLWQCYGRLSTHTYCLCGSIVENAHNSLLTECVLPHIM